MTSLATLPVYAPPGREVKVIFSLSGSGTNFIRVWVTAAPPGSELRKKIDDSTQNRFEAHTGDAGPDHPWVRNFDVGGKYTLVVQEYVRGASDYGGGYQKSPAGAPSETKVGPEVTLSLYIGQRMTSTIQVGADTLDLVLWVWESSIRRTTKNEQGEDSPAIVATSETPRARAAVEATSVIAALAALVDVFAGLALGSVSTVLTDLVAKWNAHLIEAGIHANNDTLNGMAPGFGATASASSLAETISEILPLVRQHYLNDAVKGGVTSGRDSGDFHVKAGIKKNDSRDLPVIQGASGLSDGYWAVAELCRSYTAHHPSSTFHTLPDDINPLADRPLIMQLGEAVLEVLASTSVPTPSTQSVAAMALISSGGFSETPL
jgi:hypothetical protein